MRKKHIKNLLFDHLNINWLRNKKEYLEPLIRNHFDKFSSVIQNSILILRNLNLQFLVIDYFEKTEINMMKIWFFITGRCFYKTSIRRRCTSYRHWNVLCLLRLTLEINLRNKEIPVIGCYKPSSLNDEYFLDQLHGALRFYSTTYDNLFVRWF